MIDQLIGDDRLRVDLAELAMNLEALSPADRPTKFRLSGDEPLSMAEAMAPDGHTPGDGRPGAAVAIRAA